MKVSVDVDCTPEEARRFLGLPDLAPVHDLYLDKLKRFVDEGVTPDMVETMMRGWGPMSDAGMTMWKAMLDQVGSFSTKT